MPINQYSFFAIEAQLDKINEINDFLSKLHAIIPWEMFRPELNKVREKERLSNAGRPPFDVVLMFKILILKKLYNLSDAQTELQIRDRITFRAFLGLLNFADRVPDEKTIWLFAEQLKDLGLERALFDRFDAYLVAEGFHAKSGLMVDGSFVEVPKQRNTKETADCRRQTTADFSAVCKLPSAVFHGFGDSAYVGKETEEKVLERGFLPMICEKGFRNKPLTEERREALSREVVFFRNNRDRMEYKQFREQGLPIGSGVIEAACKSVVKCRFCRSGMRWTRAGGQTILTLRTVLKSERWETFWTQYKKYLGKWLENAT
jgi:IS5 family transposase